VAIEGEAVRQSVGRKMYGVYTIVLTPMIIVIGLVLFWIMSLFFAIPILLIMSVVYVWILFGEITYGPKQLIQISIPNAPEHIMNLLELLKTTTIRGDLINVHLVAAFEDGGRFNQSALANHIISHYKVQLTPQTIKEQYISKLEKMGIIHSDSISKEKAYRLTPRGELCLEIVKTCFPRTNFWFFVRHYLGIMKLPQYPDAEKEKTMADFTNCCLVLQPASVSYFFGY